MVPPSRACLFEALINAAETVGAITITPPELIPLVMRTVRQEHLLQDVCGQSRCIQTTGECLIPPPPPPPRQPEPLLERGSGTNERSYMGVCCLVILKLTTMMLLRLQSSPALDSISHTDPGPQRLITVSDPVQMLTGC